VGLKRYSHEWDIFEGFFVPFEWTLINSKYLAASFVQKTNCNSLFVYVKSHLSLKKIFVIALTGRKTAFDPENIAFYLQTHPKTCTYLLHFFPESKGGKKINKD
jgi:hypothetical protein